MWLTSVLKDISLALADIVFPLRNTASLVRDCTPQTFGKLLIPHFSKAGHIGLLPYRHSVVRAVILEAKFHRNPKAYSLLGAVFTDYVNSMREDMQALHTTSYAILPVPLSENRYRERGYNQVEEVLKSTPLSYDTNSLIRVKDTKPQTTLSKKARMTNVTDAFITRGAFQDGVTYIAVDDVTTTGATLTEIANTLKKKNVCVVTLALAY